MTKLNNLSEMTDTELRRDMQQAMRTLARNGLIADSRDADAHLNEPAGLKWFGKARWSRTKASNCSGLETVRQMITPILNVIRQSTVSKSFKKTTMILGLAYRPSDRGFCFDVRWVLVQTGNRYQMTIPGVIDIRKVHDGLSDWLKRMDQENLNPNDLFATLSARDAKSWEARLMHMDVAARVADRAILLGGPA